MSKGICGRKLFDTAVNFLSRHLPILDPHHLVIRNLLSILTNEDWENIADKKRSNE